MKTARALIHSQARENRAAKRFTTVLRVGLLSDGSRTSFCVVRNISPTGVQVRVYSPVRRGDRVKFRVGDSNLLEGRVIWKRGQLAGIEFERNIDPGILLRTTDKNELARRRSSPRAQAAAYATLRTGGRTFAAELCDISTIGTKLRTRKAIAKGSPALLTLPDLPTIRGHVRWSDGLLSGFMFEVPLPVSVIANWINERKRVNEDISA